MVDLTSGMPSVLDDADTVSRILPRVPYDNVGIITHNATTESLRWLLPVGASSVRLAEVATEPSPPWCRICGQPCDTKDHTAVEIEGNGFCSSVNYFRHPRRCIFGRRCIESHLQTHYSCPHCGSWLYLYQPLRPEQVPYFVCDLGQVQAEWIRLCMLPDFRALFVPQTVFFSAEGEIVGVGNRLTRKYIENMVRELYSKALLNYHEMRYVRNQHAFILMWSSWGRTDLAMFNRLWRAILPVADEMLRERSTHANRDILTNQTRFEIPADRLEYYVDLASSILAARGPDDPEATPL